MMTIPDAPTNLVAAVDVIGTAPTFEDDFSTISSFWVPSNWAVPTSIGVGSFKPSALDTTQGCLRVAVQQFTDPAASTSGEIQLQKKLGYGKYEFVMRASSTSPTMNGAGTVKSGQISTCWTFLPDANFNSITELDMPEIEGSRPTIPEFTSWKDGKQTEVEFTVADPSQAFHTYGFVWSPGSVAIYYDGVLMKTITGANVPTQPAMPMISHYATNKSTFGGVMTPNTTRYMYVKSFKFWAA